MVSLAPEHKAISVKPQAKQTLSLQLVKALSSFTLEPYQLPATYIVMKV